MAERKTHNIVTFDLDDQIVSEVQTRAGIDYSAAVRTIIREFGRINGLPQSATPEVVRKPRKMVRKPAKRLAATRLASIAGLSKGLVN